MYISSMLAALGQDRSSSSKGRWVWMRQLNSFSLALIFFFFFFFFVWLEQLSVSHFFFCFFFFFLWVCVWLLLEKNKIQHQQKNFSAVSDRQVWKNVDELKRVWTVATGRSGSGETNDADRRFHGISVAVVRRVMEGCISYRHDREAQRCSAFARVCWNRERRRVHSEECVLVEHSRTSTDVTSDWTTWQTKEQTLIISSRLTMSRRHGSMYRSGMAEWGAEYWATLSAHNG